MFKVVLVPKNNRIFTQYEEEFKVEALSSEQAQEIAIKKAIDEYASIKNWIVKECLRLS